MPRFSARRPGAQAAYTKAHGLGNDYLVVEEGADWTVSQEAVRRVCHRWEGVGGDGIVVLLAPPGRGESLFRLRMFNPDGSEFERSGNGLRILASHLLGSGRVEVGKPFEVSVGGDRVGMVVHGRDPDGALDISVEMGQARTGPDAVGLDPAALAPDDRGDAHGLLDLGEPVGPLALHLVSVGNPHAVHFVPGASRGHGGGGDDHAGLTRERLDLVGPGIATHGAFAHGTNVQLARVAGPRSVEMLIWERGVGHTTGSGTSACAVAVAAVTSGRVPAGPVELSMEGGTLQVTVTEDLDVTLRGPVREVCRGRLAEPFLEALRET